MNTAYYIETIDFRIREKFKHQYGGSPYNVALFLIFARNTSTVRTKLTNKRSAQNAGNGISRLQISKMFWGRMPPDPLAEADLASPATRGAGIPWGGVRLATSRPWGREGVGEGARDPSDEVASGRLVSLAGI